MRKLLVIVWGVAACLLAVGFLRPVALDAQVSRTTWCQVAVTDGSVRLMAVRGNPSDSPPATVVFEREKNTWRNVVSGAMWGRSDHWSLPVDVPGTVMDTYRLDIPLVWLLILVPLLRPGWWVIERYRAPPRFVWTELWARRPRETGLKRVLRRSTIAVCLAIAVGALSVYWATYQGLSTDIKYVGDRFAVLLPMEGSGGGISWFVKDRYEQAVLGDDARTQVLPSWHVTLEIMRFGRVALRWLSAQSVADKTVKSFEYSWAEVSVSRRPVFRPGSRHPSGWIGIPIPPAVATTIGVERSVVVPLWFVALVASLYPIVAFLRGPLRRARWRADGCCRWCGYDLTGNESGVCPECGEVTTYASN